MSFWKKLRKVVEQDGDHRLSDIESDEVGIVDRGANRRKFLVVKADTSEGRQAGEVVDDGAGGHTTIVKDGETQLALPAEIKQVIMDAGSKVLERFTSIMERLDDVPTTTEKADDDAEKRAGAVAEKAKAMLEGINADTTALESYLTEGWRHVLTEKQEGAPAHSALLKETVQGMQNLVRQIVDGVGTLKADELRTKASLLSDMAWKVGRESEKVKAIVEKADKGESKAAGHWMSMMKEFFDYLKGVMEADAQKRAPRDAPTSPGDANVGSGQQSDASAAVPAKDFFPKEIPALAALFKSIEGLTAKVEKQEEVIKGLRRETDLPQSARPEEIAKRRSDNDSGKTSWPLDMNRPLDKEAIPPGESFL